MDKFDYVLLSLGSDTLRTMRKELVEGLKGVSDEWCRFPDDDALAKRFEAHTEMILCIAKELQTRKTN